MRSYQLFHSPPIGIEVKFGEKNEKGYPTKLKYFKVVTRERGAQNYMPSVEVHEELTKRKYGEQPTVIPIRLLSDECDENFPIFRGMFYNSNFSKEATTKATKVMFRNINFGMFMCGTNLENDTAKRFFDETPVRDKETNKVRGHIVDGTTANGREVDCNENCVFWQNDMCKLNGNLYFRLDPMLPMSNILGVIRIGGVHSMRRMRASLEIMSKETNGILANLPMQLRIHFESKTDKNGKSQSIPIISIEPSVNQFEFQKALLEEIKRRAEVFRVSHGREHTSLDEIRIVGVLDNVNERNAIVSPDDDIAHMAEAIQIEDDSTDVLDVDSTDNGTDFDDEINQMLEKLPKAKRRNVIRKFESTEHKSGYDLDALKRYLEEISE